MLVLGDYCVRSAVRNPSAIGASLPVEGADPQSD